MTGLYHLVIHLTMHRFFYWGIFLFFLLRSVTKRAFSLRLDIFTDQSPQWSILRQYLFQWSIFLVTCINCYTEAYPPFCLRHSPFIELFKAPPFDLDYFHHIFDIYSISFLLIFLGNPPFVELFKTSLFYSDFHHHRFDICRHSIRFSSPQI